MTLNLNSNLYFLGIPRNQRHRRHRWLTIRQEKNGQAEM